MARYRYRYRDSRTGRFVSESTWKRSKAQGGKRYKRERETIKKKKREIALPPLPPPPGSIWRVTVSAPYYHRAAGKKKKKKSRQSISSSYMVRSWFKTRAEAEEALEELTQRAIDGRLDVLESKSRVWWNGDEDTVNTEVTKVPYDQRYLYIVEEKDENIS
jgi:hypothetical protein